MPLLGPRSPFAKPLVAAKPRVAAPAMTDDIPWLAKVPNHNPHDTSSDAALHHRAMLACFTALWTQPSLAVTCQLWISDRLAAPPDVDERPLSTRRR